MGQNLALKEARLRAHMSQDDLARRIRESGFLNGDTNACTARMVQRWESGDVRRPQGRYLLALESVLGQPAENLGFADAVAGMDRQRALADAGMDSAMPLPDPRARYGPLTGIWLSRYEFESSGRGILTNRHYVLVLQHGAILDVHSMRASVSRLSMRMDANGAVVTGTWTEQTSQEGRYRGAVYHGAIQMLLDPTGRRLDGKWVGFGRRLEMKTGDWSLELVTESIDPETMREYDIRLEPPE